MQTALQWQCHLWQHIEATRNNDTCDTLPLLTAPTTKGAMRLLQVLAADWQLQRRGSTRC
jgi:hypothetical protein